MMNAKEKLWRRREANQASLSVFSAHKKILAELVQRSWLLPAASCSCSFHYCLSIGNSDLEGLEMVRAYRMLTKEWMIFVGTAGIVTNHDERWLD
ncbi:hypothetical protein AAC387_Pa05g3733 [Persea americana]